MTVHCVHFPSNYRLVWLKAVHFGPDSNQTSADSTVRVLSLSRLCPDSVRCLSARIRSVLILSTVWILSGLLEKNCSGAGLGRDRAVRTFTVLVRQRLTRITRIVLFSTVQSKKLKKILTLRQTTNSIWNNFEKFQFEKFMMLFMEFPTIQFPSQLLSKSLHTVSSTVKLNKGLDSKQIFTTIWSPSSRLWRMVLKIDSMHGGKFPKDSSSQNCSIV